MNQVAQAEITKDKDTPSDNVAKLRCSKLSVYRSEKIWKAYETLLRPISLKRKFYCAPWPKQTGKYTFQINLVILIVFTAMSMVFPRGTLKHLWWTINSSTCELSLPSLQTMQRFAHANLDSRTVAVAIVAGHIEYLCILQMHIICVLFYIILNLTLCIILNLENSNMPFFPQGSLQICPRKLRTSWPTSSMTT